MYYVILTVHLVLCVSLIVLVLIQQGKGADMGAAFGGGGSNTFFGAAGATAFITKLTTGIAVAFMLTSMGLIYFDPSLSGGVPTGVLQGEGKVKKLLDSVNQPAPAAQPANAAQENAPAPVENSDKK